MATILRLVGGWMLMGAGAYIPLSQNQSLQSDLIPSGLLFATIFTLFFYFLKPRFGAIYEGSTVISTLVVFGTLGIFFSLFLGNTGDWPIAVLIDGFQRFLIGVTGSIVGEEIATFAWSPILLLTAIILLSSFSLRDSTGFYIILGLLIIYGLIPFNIFLLLGALVWCAGFPLVCRHHIHLPDEIGSSLTLSEAEEDFLLGLRDRPLTEGQARLLLDGEAGGGELIVPGSNSTETINRLRKLSDAGLIEYDASTHALLPSKILSESQLPPGAAKFVETCGNLATLVLVGLAVGYLLLPFDLLPEAAIGAVGFVDDVVMACIALLPIGKRTGSWLERLSNREQRLKSRNLK